MLAAAAASLSGALRALALIVRRGVHRDPFQRSGFDARILNTGPARRLKKSAEFLE